MATSSRRLAFSLGLAACVLLSPACAVSRPSEPFTELPKPSHSRTRYEVRTASGLEALCLVNALGGNPLTMQSMSGEAAYWRAKLDPASIAAIEPFARWMKRSGSPVNGLLLKPFVAAGAESLDEVIALCDRRPRLEEAMKAVQAESGPRNTYYEPKGFEEFARLLKPLGVLMRGLKAAGFEEEWAATTRPRLEAQGERLLAKANSYNVVPMVERALGFSLGSDEVRFYLLEDLKPYGNHIIPGIFATEPRIPDDHIVRTALHELMHDPCYRVDPEFWKTSDVAFSDPFVAKAYKGRNTDFGYNNPGYYYVENAVRAMEQISSEELGIGRPRKERFGPSEDGGMHVLAPAFYVLMKDEGMLSSDEGFRAFIIRMAREGKFAKGKIEGLSRRYFDLDY
jgi:hypothetical protein